MRIISFLLFLCLMFLTSCFIEENDTLDARIVGKWAFSGRTAFFNDGSSDRNLPLDPCEFETEFIFNKEGTLQFLDYSEKEINDGTVDFCEENLITSEVGVWNILPSDKLIITLKNTEDNTDIIIEPYSIEVLNEEQLNIQYNEVENEENEMISNYVYHYFRIFN